MNNKTLSFNDVLLVPQFSEIQSRKDVNTKFTFLGTTFTTPIVSSNMDSVTGLDMAVSLSNLGAVACLHRFNSIESNIKMLEASQDAIFNSKVDSNNIPWVSVGLGKEEFNRARDLILAGARVVVIDVAHGATQAVVDMYDKIRQHASDSVNIVVGNFATSDTIKEFNKRVKSQRKPDAFKVNIGGGSMCTTRLVTGVGVPAFSSIQDCVSTGYNIIADGGIKTPGDMVKALAAGAKVVMVGRPLAGTKEAEGTIVERNGVCYKAYRGSASKDSYMIQNKLSEHRTPEGESTLVPLIGSVKDVVLEYNAGLRSAMSYLGVTDIKDIKERAKFIEITSAGWVESGPHGKSTQP